LGYVELVEGKSDRASRHLEEALDLAQRGLPPRLVRPVQRCLAERYLLANHPEAAITRIESVIAAEEGRDSVDGTALLPLLAWAYMRVKRWEEAGLVIQEALERAR
jgi:hypothetical protein